MNPSPSAQNPISQPLKKANPSSHFTPSRPSLEPAAIGNAATTCAAGTTGLMGDLVVSNYGLLSFSL